MNLNSLPSCMHLHFPLHLFFVNQTLCNSLMDTWKKKGRMEERNSLFSHLFMERQYSGRDETDVLETRYSPSAQSKSQLWAVCVCVRVRVCVCVCVFLFACEYVCVCECVWVHACLSVSEQYTL